MDCIATHIPYRQTGYFTKTALDYIDQAPSLSPFFLHTPSLQGIKDAIEAKKKSPVNRNVLVRELEKQYARVKTDEKVIKNIHLLESDNTFTITTAHQPNIFTGPLYFIYKTLHVIRLSAHLKKLVPGYDFVPVFYMGSEDADLDELGHCHLEGKKLKWDTPQTGAVGRMKVDKGFLSLIDQVDGQLSVLPYGKEIVSLVRKSYRENDLIQDATFAFINELFGEFGLVVIIPDTADFKRQLLPVFEDDLLHQTPSAIVGKTVKQLHSGGYKVQANPRDINLFYLKDNMRERIIKQDSVFRVQHSTLEFSESQIQEELRTHPERFSPNVILRGLFQEAILPNLVFIGGGGELAYWLQLKELFGHYRIPYPLLLLRNSFLIVEKKWSEKIQKLELPVEEFFKDEVKLMNFWIDKNNHTLALDSTFESAKQLFESLKTQIAPVDNTLVKHTEALQAKFLKKLTEVETKLYRAERKKLVDVTNQVNTIKEKLFPINGLQERFDNFMPYYAKWGKSFFQQLYQNSLNLEQEFVVLREK